MNDLGKLSRLALCCCVVLVSCTRNYDRYGAGDALFDAFLAMDIEKAKSVTVPEQWDRIEALMAEREPFKCRGESNISGSSRRITDYEWTYGAIYQCLSPPHCLEIDDILLKKTEDGWKVYDWGKMCEASDYGVGCVCDP
jgi:hypothetical protein